MVRSSLHLILNRDARTMQYPRRTYSYSNSHSLMERSQHSSYSPTASAPQESQQDWNNKNLLSPSITTSTTTPTKSMKPKRNKTKKTKKKIVIVEMDGLLFCKDEHADESSSADINDDQENESDVSSLDSYGSVTSDYHRRHELKQRQQGQERRTIFQKHWEMKRRISEGTSATMDSTIAFSNNSTSLTTQQQQQQQQPFSNRRSLFPRYATSSMPTFMTPPATTSERVRKTNSTSALLNRRRPSSILRRLDSNSSHKNNNSNNNLSSSSVTFDPKVSIFEFEQPSEFYDPRDWYKFFH